MSDLPEILTGARRLIADHGWTQCDYGRVETGFCLFGAVDTAYWEIRENRGGPLNVGLFDVMARIRSVRGGLINPIDWNDAPGRTREEVLSLIDETLSIPPLAEMETAVE